MPQATIVLGFDQSVTRSGWAVAHGADRRLLACGSFASEGPTDDARIHAFAGIVAELIEEHSPTFLCWEAPTPFIAGYAKKAKPDLIDGGQGRWTVNARQLLLPQLHGALLALAAVHALAHEAVPTRTWRKAIYGTGLGNLPRDEAKKHAMKFCRLAGYGPKNNDVAEAICIALWGVAHSQRRKLLEAAA